MPLFKTTVTFAMEGADQTGIEINMRDPYKLVDLYG
jgi:hypothetical protein